MTEIHSKLGELLAAEVRSAGPLPFSRFMELALYHPEHGYYTGGRVKIGPGGDFVTAPHQSALFARCLARLLVLADEALGHPDTFLFAEGGPGEGVLARDTLDRVAASNPALYARLRYFPEEKSPALRERQLENLKGHAHLLLSHAPEGYAGLYLSNELLDAFPFHLLETDGEEIREVCVGLAEEGFVEVTREAREGELLTEARNLLASLKEKGVDPAGLPWRFEIATGVGAWLRKTAGALGRGFIVTIDYGDEEARLYGPHLPQGTARGYSDMRIVDDILANPGDADLTASVNFSNLRRLGEESGLACGDLLNQRELLFALGLPQELAELEAETSGEAQVYALRQELWPLLFPGTGMGETFKALVLAKGVKPLTALAKDSLEG